MSALAIASSINIVNVSFIFEMTLMLLSLLVSFGPAKLSCGSVESALYC